MAEGNFNADFMNLIRAISRMKFYGVLIMLIPFNALSQTDTISTFPKTDTSNTVSGGSRHSLFTGIGYGSNMIYMGSTISKNQPFGYTAFTYGFKDKFFATLSTIHFSGINPYFSLYSGSLNYNHVFNTWFDISAGVSGYQFSQTLADTLFSNFLYSDLTLGIDWRLIYSKVSLGGLISDESSAYFQVRNSRYFQTPKFIKDKGFLSFEPFVNLLFGTLLKAEDTAGNIVRKPNSFGRKNSWKPHAVRTSYTTTFGILEFDFGLPVSLNFDEVTIEAEASYVLPAYDNQEFPGPKGFVFLLSCYFRIF